MSLLSCVPGLRKAGRVPPFLASSLDEKYQAPVKCLDSSSRLASLRSLMTDSKIDIYIVPSTDAHASEYLADQDRRRAFISGFTGSAGTAIVTRDEALLFTDSRYWVQASHQLDKNWQLQKVGDEGVKNWIPWLVYSEQEAPASSRIGVDPTLISATKGSLLAQDLEKAGKRLVYVEDNLVDEVWGDARPTPKQTTLQRHSEDFAGQPASEKLAKLRSYLTDNGSLAYLTSSLADIMWVLNIRGQDIPYNPFAFSHLYVAASEEAGTTLFIDPRKVGKDEEAYLSSLGVRLWPYHDIVEFLGDLRSDGGTVLVSADASVSVALASALPKGIVLRSVASPIEAWKAVKNQTEIAGFRSAYLRDAGAWCRWAAWLEEQIEFKRGRVDEWKAAEELTRYREKLPRFAGLAYENISATNMNAALPHYTPSPDNKRVIDRETPYLNDSGAQYLDGTIDTTRTVHFGRPTPDQKRAFTLVLQGHIAVASATFPSGTSGAKLDTLARVPGWRFGQSYGHGTGHGVGSYGGVHEGPHGLGASTVPLVAGHTLTIEPGAYFEGRFGVRTESFFVVKAVDLPDAPRGTQWFGFERFTQVPISRKMVNYSLLTAAEKKWLARHNADCKKAVFPLIKDDKRAVAWLMKQ